MFVAEGSFRVFIRPASGKRYDPNHRCGGKLRNIVEHQLADVDVIEEQVPQSVYQLRTPLSIQPAKFRQPITEE
jgi:hypothetical protein